MVIIGHLVGYIKFMVINKCQNPNQLHWYFDDLYSKQKWKHFRSFEDVI